jgi:hypothetical protein
MSLAIAGYYGQWCVTLPLFIVFFFPMPTALGWNNEFSKAAELKVRIVGMSAMRATTPR